MALSTFGAAVTYDDFGHLKDWLCEANRPIEIQDFVYPDVIVEDCTALVEAYQKALDGHKGPRGIHGPFFGLDLSNPDRDIRAIVQQRFMKGLEIAEALSATHMVIHSPFTFWHHLNRRNYPNVIPDMYEAAADCLTPVLAHAGNIGCTLMLENIDDTDPATRVDLVRQIDHPNLKVSIDTGHADLAHNNYSAPPVNDFIAAASGVLGHVHLQDVDGYADRHWHPGEGDINWSPLLKALERLEECPRLILEVRRYTDQLPKTVAWLEGLA
ncbi:sugar phosphate isomerase/epimerase family protein [Donghicola tyrosinivorans]|uniref:Sugar phosphate isomerase/epimerase n=1 Tax=Donghicola tyrosinivorans TaxID=1652492 RepID=A0A2T0WRM3_9RHOB|nr:sugar phosphate isomerase/epimerase family protein [Donghicola tyrosinivorans]PRY89349.1 sugar phosphate isomerase/epimerase [Donghicola tyrosinivorans]